MISAFWAAMALVAARMPGVNGSKRGFPSFRRPGAWPQDDANLATGRLTG